MIKCCHLSWRWCAIPFKLAWLQPHLLSDLSEWHCSVIPSPELLLYLQHRVQLTSMLSCRMLGCLQNWAIAGLDSALWSCLVMWWISIMAFSHAYLPSPDKVKYVLDRSVPQNFFTRGEILSWTCPALRAFVQGFLSMTAHVHLTAFVQYTCWICTVSQDQSFAPCYWC